MPEPLAQATTFETATGVLVVGLGGPLDAGGFPTSDSELAIFQMDVAPNPVTPELASTNQETSPTGCGS